MKEIVFKEQKRKYLKVPGSSGTYFVYRGDEVIGHIFRSHRDKYHVYSPLKDTLRLTFEDLYQITKFMETLVGHGPAGRKSQIDLDKTPIAVTLFEDEE